MFKQAAGLVAKRGYTKIMMFRGGIPEWAQAGYPLEHGETLSKADTPSVDAAALKVLLGKATIVDIRTPSLYSMGWIAGSLKIPLAYLTQRFEEIPKDKPVVLVDHSGKQVNVAARFLHSKGYDVTRFQGGLLSWVKSGFPLEK